jgi:hypothetical protein
MEVGARNSHEAEKKLPSEAPVHDNTARTRSATVGSGFF